MNQLKREPSQFGQTGGVNELQIRRMALYVGLIIAAVFVCFYAVKTQNPILGVGLVGLPIALMLMNRPGWMFVAALVLDAMNIPIPGVPNASMGLLVKLLLIGSALLGVLLGRRQWHGQKMAESKPLLCFAGVIIALMVFRGSGLRMLGSSTWGGMVYVVMFCGLAFFFAVNGLRVSKKQIRWIVWGSAIAGLGGALISHSGGAAMSEEGVGATRMAWLSPVASGLFPLVFALKFRKTPWVSGLLLLVCLAMVGLTGFRSRLVGMVSIAGLYGLFKARDKLKYIVIMGGVGLLAWLGVVLLSPHLPLGLQRAVSFVPGAVIDYATAQDAEGSIEWRIEIWDYCLAQAKQFLWLGRGSAFNVWETSAQVSDSDISIFSPWLAYLTHAYHSGPLTLLIDYGLPGLLAFFWLTCVSFKRLCGFAVRLAKVDTFESRYALYLCVSLLWMWVSYYLVYGGAPEIAGRFMKMGSVYVLAASVLFVPCGSKPK